MKTMTYLVNEKDLKVLKEDEKFINYDTADSGTRFVGIINNKAVVCMPQIDKMYIVIKETDDRWFELPPMLRYMSVL